MTKGSIDLNALSAVIRGEPGPVRAFIAEYGPVLRRVVRRTLPQKQWQQREDDILQELFLGIFRDRAAALRAWDPAGGRSLRTFLCVFAHRRIIDQLRQAQRRHRERPMEEQELHRQADAGAEGDGEADLPAWVGPLFLRFREEATPVDWKVLEMSFLEERDVGEIAAVLHLSVDAVYQRRHRIRQRLLRMKAEFCPPDSPPDARISE